MKATSTPTPLNFELSLFLMGRYGLEFRYAKEHKPWFKIISTLITTQRILAAYTM